MITVRACKYDGKESRRWSANVVRQEGSLLVLDASFPEEINHDLLGTIERGTRSIEYYWLDRWYNIFRFSQPDGDLRSFYCNVNSPPEFDGQTLNYVDLDIDILVEPDLTYRVVDLTDFELNARHYDYSAAVQANAKRALAQLIDLIETRSFPFTDSVPQKP
jgi:uncharacterized protein